MTGERRWRWAPGLALIAVCALGVSGATLRTRANLESAPSARTPEGAPRSETPAAGAAQPPPGRTRGEPSLVARAAPSVPPAPDASATASVTGRVVDALGGPIAGAAVSVWSEHPERLLSSTLTRASGGFELRAPPGHVRVLVRDDAYATALQRVVAPAGELTFALGPASRIFGRVHGASDAPLGGIVVRARPLGRLDPLVSSAVTDREGHFRFEALSAGEYELRATGERLQGDAERLVLGVAEAAGPFELGVAPAVRVALRVERRGRACTGGWVQLVGERLQDARELADGRVLFEAVPAGDYQLSVACERAAFQNHQLEVRDDDIDDTLRVDPGQLVAGRVLDAAGTGAAGVLVSVSPLGLPDGRAYMTCRSGAGGAFACDGLSPGAYRCHAGLELQPQSEFVDVSVAAGTDPGPIELKLPPRAMLVVSLEHAPPEQLSNAHVLARAAEGPTLEGERRGSEFHFEGLLLGSYEVYLAASPGTRRDVSLVRDSQREAITLAWPSTRTISGVVLDERNQPVVDVWVRAAAEGGLLPSLASPDVGVPALTDAAGRFSLEGLFEGRYHLRVESTEREGLARGVPGGAEDVVIHLAPPSAASEASNTDVTNG